MKIYVASSWRNEHQPDVVDLLLRLGHEVYDFRHPNAESTGFSWAEIDANWQKWDPDAFRSGLDHPLARNGFKLDMDALKWCDACVLVMPCGRSAHLELGWAAGAGKWTIILLSYDSEPELMYSMADVVCVDIIDLMQALR